MDRNSIIGFILLILLFTVWMQVNNSNSQKELIEKKRQDSIALAQKHKSLPANDTLVASQDTSVKSDSTKLNIGGPEQTEVLENNLMQVTITNKGAKIKEVWLKEYKTSAEDSNYHEVRRPLKLFNTPTDQLSYTIPTGNGSSIQTGQLPAHIEKSGNTVVLKTPLPNGTTLEQSYTLSDKQYTLSYES